jgi:hypothetical protein
MPNQSHGNVAGALKVAVRGTERIGRSPAVAGRQAVLCANAVAQELLGFCDLGIPLCELLG